MCQSSSTALGITFLHSGPTGAPVHQCHEQQLRLLTQCNNIRVTASSWRPSSSSVSTSWIEDCTCSLSMNPPAIAIFLLAGAFRINYWDKNLAKSALFLVMSHEAVPILGVRNASVLNLSSHRHCLLSSFLPSATLDGQVVVSVEKYVNAMESNPNLENQCDKNISKIPKGFSICWLPKSNDMCLAIYNKCSFFTNVCNLQISRARCVTNQWPRKKGLLAWL